MNCDGGTVCGLPYVETSDDDRWPNHIQVILALDDTDDYGIDVMIPRATAFKLAMKILAEFEPASMDVAA